MKIAENNYKIANKIRTSEKCRVKFKSQNNKIIKYRIFFKSQNLLTVWHLEFFGEGQLENCPVEYKITNKN